MPWLAAWVGFAEGVVVGTALIAFLTMLKVVPHLTWRVGSSRNQRLFDGAVILGAVIGALLPLFHGGLTLPNWSAAVVGVVVGIFVGMTAAALAEVLLVLPILDRRLALGRWIRWLVIALAVGKGAGALLDWLWHR